MYGARFAYANIFDNLRVVNHPLYKSTSNLILKKGENEYFKALITLRIHRKSINLSL